MKKLLKVILDCDDVLYDCNNYAVERLNAKKGTNFTIDDITKWGILGNVLDERLKYFSDPEFIRTMPVIHGAKEFVKKLSRKAEIFVCTSVNSTCAGERIAAVIRDFPEIKLENILIGHRKDIVQADLILDDGYHNIQNSQVEYPVLFRRPWNKDVTGSIAVSTYDEFLTLIDMIFDTSSNSIENPKIIGIVGPSGSGKTCLVNKLLESGEFERVKSYTTRARRTASEEEYHYINDETFLKMKREGKFFETSAYAGHYYGTVNSDISDINSKGKKALLVLDINGAISIKKHFGMQALTIFVEREKTDSIRSILERNLPLEESVKRITSLDGELKNAQFCDMIVKNTDINTVYEDILREVG